MGSYGIGVGRALACAAEEHRDRYGLRLPITIAPYQVHLCRLAGSRSEQVHRIADQLYDGLRGRGVEVLYDDRDERPGVQFADADLIGLPLRVTIGDKALARGGIEVKHRDADNAQVVAVDEVVAHIVGQIETLFAEVGARVVPVELA
jgi:prolyl-tRNA synthetase